MSNKTNMFLETGLLIGFCNCEMCTVRICSRIDQTSGVSRSSASTIEESGPRSAKPHASCI